MQHCEHLFSQRCRTKMAALLVLAFHASEPRNTTSYFTLRHLAVIRISLDMPQCLDALLSTQTRARGNYLDRADTTVGDNRQVMSLCDPLSYVIGNEEQGEDLVKRESTRQTYESLVPSTHCVVVDTTSCSCQYC